MSFALAGEFFTTRPPGKIIEKDNEDLEKLEPSNTVGGNVKQCCSFGKQSSRSSEV